VPADERGESALSIHRHDRQHNHQQREANASNDQGSHRVGLPFTPASAELAGLCGSAGMDDVI
jgi:hypothetical protein